MNSARQAITSAGLGRNPRRSVLIDFLSSESRLSRRARLRGETLDNRATAASHPPGISLTFFSLREEVPARIGAALSWHADVRSALRAAPGRAQRRSLAGQALRGRRQQGPARGAPRAARGRRQLQGRQGLHRLAAGAPRRRGDLRGAQSRPDRDQGGQRRAHRADGRRRPRPGLRAERPHRDPDGRPAGLRQDDRLREAGKAAREAEQGRRPRGLRPAAPRRRRAAREARRPGEGPRLLAAGRDRRGQGGRPGPGSRRCARTATC